MKNLFLSLVLVMVGLTANSQVITVTARKLQNFKHESNISTISAIKSNSIEYPYYVIDENIFKFDLDNKTLTIDNSRGSSVYTIVEINSNSTNVIDCVTMFNGTATLFLLGKSLDNQDEFIMEEVSGDKVNGFFSLGSDFDCVIK